MRNIRNVFLAIGIWGLLVFVEAWLREPCLPANSRAKVARVKAELRSLSSAIESYDHDRGEYPSDIHVLTTPIAYMATLLPDVFASKNDTSYHYWTTIVETDRDSVAKGWIALSPGPDGDYDITNKNVALLYASLKSIPSDLLFRITYDPSNGMASNGDIWRTKQ